MKNKSLMILLILIFLHFSINLSCAQESSNVLTRQLDSAFINSAKLSLCLKGDFKLYKKQDAAGTRRLEYRSPTDYLVIKVWFDISDSLSIKMTGDKKFLIENLFLTQPSPYPDDVSNHIVCPERLKPLKFDSIGQNIRISAFRLYANERFVYGECADDVIIYTSAYIIVYNKIERILTEIKYFTPKTKPINIPEEVMRSVKVIID